MNARSLIAGLSFALLAHDAQCVERMPADELPASNPDLRHRMIQLVWDITGHLGDMADCGVHGQAFTSRGATIYDNPRFGILRDWMRASQVALPPAKPASEHAGPPSLESCLGSADRIIELLGHHGDDIDRLAEPGAAP